MSIELIARINAALDEAEAWARAACQAYPYAVDKTLPPDGVSWEWVAGEDWEPATPDPALDEFVAPAGDNCWLATKETWPDDRGRLMQHTYTHTVVEMDAAAGGHIIRWDPKTVLALIEAHREMLAWAQQRNCDGVDHVFNPVDPEDVIEMLAKAHRIDMS